MNWDQGRYLIEALSWTILVYKIYIYIYLLDIWVDMYFKYVH